MKTREDAEKILGRHYPLEVAKTDDLLNEIIDAMLEFAQQPSSDEVRNPEPSEDSNIFIENKMKTGLFNIYSCNHVFVINSEESLTDQICCKCGYRMPIEQQQPSRERMESAINELKEFNPYPDTVFIPIPDEKMDAIVKLLKDNGYSSDALFGNWGRYVWDRCCEKAESIFTELSEPEKQDDILMDNKTYD